MQVHIGERLHDELTRAVVDAAVEVCGRFVQHLANGAVIVEQKCAVFDGFEGFERGRVNNAAF